MTPYFQQDSVFLYLGDCREVLPSLGSVGLVITDPPYAVQQRRREWRFTPEISEGLSLSAAIVEQGGAMFSFTTTSARGIQATMNAVTESLPFNRILVWHKAFVRSRAAGPWRWDTVAILAFGKASFGRPERSALFSSSGPSSRKNLGLGVHPAELPDGIAAWLYEPFASRGAVLLDPFCGTGQLLVPSALAGNPTIGIEIDERHCEVAARRLESALSQEKAA